MQRPPILQSSLRCDWDALDMLLGQPVDNWVAFQLARRIIPQQRLNLILPHPVEGDPCSGFACDGNGPLCHLRAERTLIPALAAAVSCVLEYVSASCLGRQSVDFRGFSYRRGTPMISAGLDIAPLPLSLRAWTR